MDTLQTNTDKNFTRKEYIEREAAYDTLTRYYHHSTDTQHGALREALSRVPAADVVPVRHGRWKRMGATCDCSVCGDTVWLGDSTVFKYCPSCGARMDGDGE